MMLSPLEQLRAFAASVAAGEPRPAGTADEFLALLREAAPVDYEQLVDAVHRARPPDAPEEARFNREQLTRLSVALRTLSESTHHAVGSLARAAADHERLAKEGVLTAALEELSTSWEDAARSLGRGADNCARWADGAPPSAPPFEVTLTKNEAGFWAAEVRMPGLPAAGVLGRGLGPTGEHAEFLARLTTLTRLAETIEEPARFSPDEPVPEIEALFSRRIA